MEAIIIVLKENRMAFDPMAKLLELKSASFFTDIVLLENSLGKFFHKMMNTGCLHFDIIFAYFEFQADSIFIIVDLIELIHNRCACFAL